MKDDGAKNCICHQGSICTFPGCDLYHHQGCVVHRDYHKDEAKTPLGLQANPTLPALVTPVRRCKTCLTWPTIRQDNGWWWIDCKCSRTEAPASFKTRSQTIRSWNVKQKSDASEQKRFASNPTE